MRSVLLTLSLLLGTMAPQVAAQCNDAVWPVYAGGQRGDEDVRCFVYDPVHELIVVGGVTTSEDFAPAPNDHGYMFALDLQGNWMWGNFFYNVSYSVSQIDGCQLSSDGSSISVMGIGNAQPLMMDLNTKDGSFNRFISLEYILTSDTVVPTYETFGAIYYDKRDYRDYQPYFYSAFIKDDVMFMLRVADGDLLGVDWNFAFQDYSDADIASNPLLNKKEPHFIVADPKSPSALYLIGRYRGLGSVIRFNKRDGQIRWHAQFNQMSRIHSYSQAYGDDDIFICGDYQPNEITDTEPYTGSNVEFRAVFARMKDDGDVSWIITATGKHPLYDGTDYMDQDKCMGIAYSKNEQKVAVVLQGKMTEVRPSYKGDYYDTILVQLDEAGETDKVVVITQGSLSYDMYPAKNGILWQGDNVFFAGKSYGFETATQVMLKDEDNLEYDAYVYKYRFGYENRCLYTYEPNARTMQRNMDFTSSQDVSSDLYTFNTTYKAVPTNREDNYYIPYPSRYSGGFTLLDTMKIPRPCAYQSQNLTSANYYRGQNVMQYDIQRENDKTISAYFSGSEVEVIFQNGTNANSLATFNVGQNSIDIQTDNDEMVGIQKTIIRACDNLDRLLEMNLYVEILSNTYPDFVSEPETSFIVAVGDTYQYKLPAVTDPEGNDKPEVYIGYMDQQEDKFPDFILYNNVSSTITFKPRSFRDSGRTYYFTIVVKEENSDSVWYSYYATVRVEGDIIDDPPVEDDPREDDADEDDREPMIDEQEEISILHSLINLFNDYSHARSNLTILSGAAAISLLLTAAV